jgi:hypothetical protein
MISNWLLKTVKDLLEIAGYNTATIEELFLSNMTTRQSLLAAWLGNANLPRTKEDVKKSK